MIRQHARRAALSLAVLAFTAGGLTACGGDSTDDAGSAPKSVSTDEFCSTYSDYFKELANVGTGADDNVVPAIKDFADKLSKLGTPSDIPDDARRGFEVSIEAVGDLPDDATIEELGNLQTDVSEKDQADATAFGTYVQKTCPDLLSDLAPSAPAS